jgi:hypothetical protein
MPQDINGVVQSVKINTYLLLHKNCQVGSFYDCGQKYAIIE